MNPIRLSIFFPAYNEEKYLPKTLESLKKLDRKPDEIIVVDGGSTDTTVVDPAAATTATQATQATVDPAAAGAPATAAPATAAPVVDNTSCTGDVVKSPPANFRWGTIQLQTTFTPGNVLCDIQVLQYPSDRGTSISINQYALPIYIQESLASHSANVRAISGATLSWRAYSSALQAVLDARPK